MAASTASSWGHPPPRLLTATLVPIALTLIAHPLLPLLPKAALPHVHMAFPPQPSFPALQANIGFSLLAFVGAVWAVPFVSESFVGKGLKGRDLCKPGGKTAGPWIPECMGLPLACWYIGLMMLFIPFPFSHIFHSSSSSDVGRDPFPQGELALYLSSLLSLLSATLLGFVDDLFDIRWRHKLPIPLIAAVPTLLVYYSEGGLTSVVLPRLAGDWLSKLGFGDYADRTPVFKLGPLYYIYLLMLPTFTTNSTNILAGINGVECIQALIIALSVAINDLFFLPIWPKWLLSALGGIGNPDEGRLLAWAIGDTVKRHLMSLYFMTPLIGICSGFLWHNWFPARAFPGDTFCYFTGMAFSAVAIQGHFSKTLILFFLPQIFNFILSCPQLFHLVPCPRHRLPRYDAHSDKLYPSVASFEHPPPLKTRVALEILAIFRLVRLERLPSRRDQDTGHVKTVDNVQSTISQGKEQIVSTTNLTILNFLLVHFGPMHEQTLCTLVAGIQVLGSVLAFGIRYGVGSWFYGGDRR